MDGCPPDVAEMFSVPESGGVEKDWVSFTSSWNAERISRLKQIEIENYICTSSVESFKTVADLSGRAGGWHPIENEKYLGPPKNQHIPLEIFCQIFVKVSKMCFFDDKSKFFLKTVLSAPNSSIINII